MKFLTILLMFTLVLCQNPSVGQKIRLITLDGNTLTGDVNLVNDIEIILSTDLGDIKIDRGKIKSLEIISIYDKPTRKPLGQSENSVELYPSLNQEARWRTIYSAMLLGNGLYGWAVPYVFGVSDEETVIASQLLMFGGGFYTSYAYTQNMDLPYGRWQFQNTGAALGALSIIPLAVTFAESWQDIDPNGKVALTYMMLMTPYGVLKADELYNKWELTNGQASLISQASGWGFLNSLGVLALVYGEDHPGSIISVKLNTLAVYGAALGAPFISKNHFTQRSYTESDASFILSSFGLGYLNAVGIASILSSDKIRMNAILFMGFTNGFGYLADKMITDIDLDRGSARIIALGSGAAFLIRGGIGIALDEEFNDMSVLLNLAALNAGWYFTFKRVSKKDNLLTNIGKSKKSISFSLAPSITGSFDRPSPGLSFRMNFY